MNVPIPLFSAVSSWITSEPSLCTIIRLAVSFRSRRAYFRGVSCGTALSMLALVPAMAGSQPASGQDANAIVRQMIATYQQATTIQETSAANFSDSKGTKLSQTYVIKYEKPNKLVIISQDPEDGTLAAYSNGRVIRFYSGSRRLYAEMPSQPDTARTVDAIGQLAHKVISNAFDQSLNPISFLLAQGMPRECRSFRYAGVKTMEGHTVHVVTGTADEAWTQSVVPFNRGKSTSRDLTLFIDTKTHLLLRAKARLVWAVTRPAQSGKAGNGKAYTILFEETHFGTAVNKPIRSEDFTFTPGADVVLKP